MSLLLTFMDLDKLYESKQWLSREMLISNIKNSGKWHYKFYKYSDEQLYRMWERIQSEDEEKAAMQEYHDQIAAEWYDTCTECGVRLNDGGTCPICDDGEEDLYEWLDANGNQIKTQSANTTTSTSSAQQPAKLNTNIVTIVYDYNKHKLRAQADDGIHGIGNVAFPNSLRTKAGQQYEVETLTWNGKNYRVSGDIKPI
jgi:hypothetical protein